MPSLLQRLFPVVCSLCLVSAALAQAPASPAAKPPLGAPSVQRSGKTFVMVYLEENFKGKVFRVEVPAELANDAQLKKLGIPNDSIQSMKIPDGVAVTLYDASNYGGKSAVFTGKVATLGELKQAASSLKAEMK